MISSKQKRQPGKKPRSSDFAHPPKRQRTPRQANTQNRTTVVESDPPPIDTALNVEVSSTPLEPLFPQIAVATGPAESLSLNDQTPLSLVLRPPTDDCSDSLDGFSSAAPATVALDGSLERPLDVDSISLVSPQPSLLLEPDPLCSLGVPTPAYEVIESTIDPVLQLNLPSKVRHGDTHFVSTPSSKASGSWAVLSGADSHLCRFCGASLAKRDHLLSALGHILGEGFYRKNGMQRKTSAVVPKCRLAPPVAVSQARSEMKKLLQPAAKPAKIEIALPSAPSATSQTQISWVTQHTVLTKATMLLAQQNLPFSHFDSAEFKDFIQTVLAVGRLHYRDFGSYQLRQHIETVYLETKTQVVQHLTNRRGPLHVSIDSCTFNTTKLIFNVLVSDEISEWYIGHATIDHLVAKDYRSMVSVFSTGLKMVENMVQIPLIAPIAPASHQPSCSVLDQLPCMRGMQSELSFELIFSHPVATIVTDGAPVNKKALQTLRTSFPEVIGIICTAHGLNLLVKHLVNKTPWMKSILNQVLEVIKFFRNRTRPRKILAMAHSKQLLLPAPTRFCYAVLSLQSFLAAAQHLKDLASSDLVSPELLKPCQQEWIKLQTDLQRSGGADAEQFQHILSLLRNSALYERAGSLLRILTPVFCLLRLFDKSSPGACGWVVCSVANLRQTLHRLITEEFQRFFESSLAECLMVVNERIRYLCTPPTVLAFFLNPLAIPHMAPEMLDNLWNTASARNSTQVEYAYQLALDCFNDCVSHLPLHINHKITQEYRDFLFYAKNHCIAWGSAQEDFVNRNFFNLQKLRSRLLSSPAVSSSSERAFSALRRIETSDRNRLSERHTEMLAFLNANLRSRSAKTALSWDDFQKVFDSQAAANIARLEDSIDHELDGAPHSEMLGSAEESEDELSELSTHDSDLSLSQFMESPNS